MIDIIRGASGKPVSTESLVEFVENSGLEDCILYTGYPIVGSIDEKNSIDGLLISAQHGVIVFDIVEEPEVSNREDIRDSLYNVVLQKLIGYKELAAKRGTLVVNLNVLTISPSWPASERNNEVIITKDDFDEFLKENIQKDLSIDYYKRLVQAVQAITKLKSKPPRKVVDNNSKGAILNEVEKSISNLDRRQSKAVIETVEGIQRIRGLAGSGKTIVLALKVAYLHSKFPDWTIGVTFYTRSLKSQFIELITKFTIEHKNEEPDWSKIKIQQAWGSSRDSGFYYEFCKLNNIEYLDYDSAKYRYKFASNYIDILSTKALSEAKVTTAIYDAILIDEAQDFSESFLKLCYSLLKPATETNPYNKRLIYAYDELQKLNEANALRNPKEIFEGIDFENIKNKPQQDIILEKCYRNSAPVLVTAHALGFGIYRENGQLVTMFSEKQLWKDVGYVVDEGSLELGQTVVLKRDSNSSPDFIAEKINHNDIINFVSFKDNDSQYEYVASEIEKNIKNDELNPRDIIVIHPNPIVAKNELAPIRQKLFSKGIESHLAGVNTSPDDFYINNSVAFTSIYRAKGNEAAMIYIVGADYCYGGFELIKKRNILFTAITRSKAWVRVTGTGNSMDKLQEEFERIREEKFRLKFRYPTLEEMDKLNILHRDLSEADKKAITESEKEALSLLSKIKNNQIHLEDLPKDTIDELRKFLNDSK
ncbi:DEAD/DEAH box helicase [Flavobacterium sp. UBA7682]|uniref:DEAD/DEAH box helicase n=1 Tax=Flavobacterium sp. UBA7682 TaxID=1946560 RepID=UPI0025C4F597|nr:ATP-binding domain-containing protein [Flavobacterium sp. UBA7682]